MWAVNKCYVAVYEGLDHLWILVHEVRSQGLVGADRPRLKSLHTQLPPMLSYLLGTQNKKKYSRIKIKAVGIVHTFTGKSETYKRQKWKWPQSHFMWPV